MVDLLYPIINSNRDEYILVEYEGFIRNISELVILALEIDKDNNIKKYPKLDEFISLTGDEMYVKSSLYTPSRLLKYLSDNTLTDKEIEEELEYLLSFETLMEFQRNTLFEYALFNLSGEDFLKKICIIKKDAYSKYELDRIYNIFGERINKLEFYVGDSIDIFNDKEFTTICMNNAEDIIKILKENDDEKLKDKLFILRNNLDNLNEVDNQYQYTHIDIFNKLTKDKSFGVIRMYTTCMEEDSQERFTGEETIAEG